MINRLSRRCIALAWLCCLGAAPVGADPLSGYLPLNLEPEIERQIERVLILADEPILKRPFPVELVKAALPAACKIDPSLCAKVRRYLDRYERDYAVTHASVTGSYTNGARVTVPNSYGLPSTSHYEVSADAYVQPSDYVLLNGGVLAYQGRTQPTGSVLSLGFSGAQLDLGYRARWLSPMTDSSQLTSTEAPTMLSATVSNWEPLTRAGFLYEFFLAEMNQTGSDSGGLPGNNILFDGVASRGNPRLAGVQLSVEPIPGWSIGVNRQLEYGGGSGLPESAHFLLRDFFEPSGLSQMQGNQEASYVSRFIYPGKTPFAVYFQYAGEDNSDGGSYLLGNVALLAGIDFPRIWHHFDATAEFAEWQNIWYVHYIFLDGMTNQGFVLGNWGADQRNFNDGVGARSLMLRIGWEPPFGGYLEERARMLVNQNYYGGTDVREYSSENPAPYPYHHYYDFTLTYSHPWQGTTLGGQVMVGRDVDGSSFTRLSAFVRYGGDHRTRDDGASPDEDNYTGGPKLQGSEIFVDVGGAYHRETVNYEPTLPVDTYTNVDPHLGVGARRSVSANNDLGVRLEVDDVNGRSLVGVRAVDWRYRFGSEFALGAFVGVDRLAEATPAYSLYGGVGVQWRDFLPRWLPKFDLDLDYQHAQNIARDHVLPSDVQGPRPETFYKIDSLLLYLSRHF